MKILIIGGTGFIGSAITNSLKLHQVFLFNRGSRSMPTGVALIRGDKNELSSYAKAFNLIQPDTIIHTIADTKNDAENFVKSFKNYRGKVIILSSGDVYQAYSIFIDGGKEQNELLKEDSPLRENLFPYRKESHQQTHKDLKELFYNYDKILVEQAVQQSGLNCTILRLAAVYGPNDPQGKLQRYVDDVRTGIDKKMSNAQLNWKWSRIFVDNIPTAIELILQKDDSVNQVYNLAETEALSIGELYELIRKLLKTDPRSQEQNGNMHRLQEEKFNYGQHLIMDSRKIRNELGYREKVEQRDALIKTISAYITG